MMYGKRARPGFCCCEVNQMWCLAKGLCCFMTLPHDNRLEFKVTAMKRSLGTESSDLSINFLLLMTLRTTCIHRAILLGHKSSRSPCDPFYQVIYAPPRGALDSVRLAICLHHPNFPIQPLSSAVNKPGSDKTVVWLPRLLGQIGACENQKAKTYNH